MSKKPPPKSFAEIVRDVRAEDRRLPAPVSNVQPIELWADFWSDEDGTTWYVVSRQLDGRTAQKMVRDGALVAWEPCGCGGFCGLIWQGEEARANLARSKPAVRPSRRFDGAVTAWRDENGRHLVVVSYPVEWDGLV